MWEERKEEREKGMVMVTIFKPHGVPHPEQETLVSVIWVLPS